MKHRTPRKSTATAAEAATARVNAAIEAHRATQRALLALQRNPSACPRATGEALTAERAASVEVTVAIYARNRVTARSAADMFRPEAR